MAVPLMAPRFKDCILPFALHVVLVLAALCTRTAAVVSNTVPQFIWTSILAIVIWHWPEQRRRSGVLLVWRLRELGAYKSMFVAVL
jgi:hypothetical protein